MGETFGKPPYCPTPISDGGEEPEDPGEFFAKTHGDLPICCPTSTASMIPGLNFGFAEDHAFAQGGLTYLGLLLWSFLAVAVVSDRFMSAIEVITSKEKVVFVTDEKTGERNKVRIKYWNDTVANLTLMALGSSAPEIILSLIELLGNDMFSGALGPNTVVGSAAFNLLVISAVCVSAIPTGETRKIIGTTVYLVTCSFSVFAYFWLYVVLEMISPNRVTVAESVVTFLFFPFLVFLAYSVDVDLFPCFAKERAPMDHVQSAIYEEAGHEVPNEVLHKIRKQIRDEYNCALNEESVQRLVVHRALQMQPKSRAYYRVHAAREMTGGGNASRVAVPAGSSKQVHPADDARSGSKYIPPASVGFCATRYACLECAKQISLAVVRSECTKDVPLMVDYTTRGGSAKPGEDYMHTDGTLEFQSGEISKEVTVKIVDDVQYEEDEDFFVDLSNVRCDYSGGKVELVHPECQVTIIDDDEPGKLQFQVEEFHVQEGKDHQVELIVERRQGSSGVVSCEFRTDDGTAKAHTDYEPVSGELVFMNGECAKSFSVPIIDDEKYEKREYFRVYLTNPKGGAKFNEKTQGGAEHCEATVFISSDDKVKGRIQEMKEQLILAEEANRVGTSNWSEQLYQALGYEEDQLMPGASAFEWFMHILALPWKLLFSLIPPTDFCGGWLCFWSSLVMIAVVTAFVGDTASLLGCSLGMPDEITAITLVALGTSLPDTFASKQAAMADPYADASIGNVTGSNSVNVFLGLGLPWSMGAVYWDILGNNESRRVDWDSRRIRTGQTYLNILEPSTTPASLPMLSGKLVPEDAGGFIVYAGDLAFSVMVYTVLALTAVLFLLWRRQTYGGELGGTASSKSVGAIFLTSLWGIYIIMSCMKTLGTFD